MSFKGIPSRKDNPDGLHARYNVSKIEGETDPSAEYFVLRLDDGGSDKHHIMACRCAMMTYAREIRPHIPRLADDIMRRYGSIEDADLIEECPGSGRCHGTQSWCPICGDVRSTCDCHGCDVHDLSNLDRR